MHLSLVQASVKSEAFEYYRYSLVQRDCTVAAAQVSYQMDCIHSMTAHSMAAIWLLQGYSNWPIRFHTLISLVKPTKSFRITGAAAGKNHRKRVKCFLRRMAVKFVGNHFLSLHRMRVVGFAGSQSITAVDVATVAVTVIRRKDYINSIVAVAGINFAAVTVDIAITAYHNLAQMPAFQEQPSWNIQLCRIGAWSCYRCFGCWIRYHFLPFECCRGLNIYHWPNVD